jgi:prepilin-type processing-associated H-X9-DG protein
MPVADYNSAGNDGSFLNSNCAGSGIDMVLGGVYSGVGLVGGAATTPCRITVGTVARNIGMATTLLAPQGYRDLPAPPNYNNAFGGPYPAGALFVFCDGHVASLSYSWMNQAGGTLFGTNLGAITSPTNLEVFTFE